MTDTELPDFRQATRRSVLSPEAIAENIRDVQALVRKAVCSDAVAQSEVGRLPAILCDQINLKYLETMARVGKPPVLEMFASVVPEHKATYKEALATFNEAATQVFQTHLSELPKGPGDEAERRSRTMLLNNHRWMTHAETCLGIWPADDMLPYMLKAPLLTLDAMLSRAGPTLNEVR